MTNYYLKVYPDKSELHDNDEKAEIFIEGEQSSAAKARYSKIQDTLSKGFLDQQIDLCRDNCTEEIFADLLQEQRELLSNLVGSVTSEVGRALVGLSILQLCIKAIEPRQSVRLHKGGGGDYNFSWKEGVSMRSLDNTFITPALRRYDLLKLNADGFMMTRSLAENYPYSMVYKANLRGARQEWLQLVEWLEDGELKPLPALRYVLSQLLNQAAEFQEIVKEMTESLKKYLINNKTLTHQVVLKLMQEHISTSSYSARVMEISMHSLMQALREVRALEDLELQPLSQMRSANKKHGNIGDIELTQSGEVTEAWDAKYGKAYLRDELEELNDKLEDHHNVKKAGFVTSEQPTNLDELKQRISEIEDYYGNGLRIQIISFESWVSLQVKRALDVGRTSEAELSKRWLVAYAESLAQLRREIAPIDEPCTVWLDSLSKMLKNT